MTSDTLTRGQIYDAASTVLQPALSQIDGIGQVTISGSSLPAVRVELNPLALFKYGIGLEDVRAALASANAHSPKGAIEEGDQALPDLHQRPGQPRRRLPAAGDRLSQWRGGAADRCRRGRRLGREICATGLSNGKPAVLVILYRQPGANIIDTVDRVKAMLPQLRASIPSDIDVDLTMDRTHDDPRLAARCRDDAGDRDRAGDPRRLPVSAQSRARR